MFVYWIHHLSHFIFPTQYSHYRCNASSKSMIQCRIWLGLCVAHECRLLNAHQSHLLTLKANVSGGFIQVNALRRPTTISDAFCSLLEKRILLMDSIHYGHVQNIHHSSKASEWANRTEPNKRNAKGKMLWVGTTSGRLNICAEENESVRHDALRFLTKGIHACLLGIT